MILIVSHFSSDMPHMNLVNRIGTYDELIVQRIPGLLGIPEGKGSGPVDRGAPVNRGSL